MDELLQIGSAKYSTFSPPRHHIAHVEWRSSHESLDENDGA
jgi:hypothetical protein